MIRRNGKREAVSVNFCSYCTHIDRFQEHIDFLSNWRDWIHQEGETPKRSQLTLNNPGIVEYSTWPSNIIKMNLKTFILCYSDFHIVHNWTLNDTVISHSYIVNISILDMMKMFSIQFNLNNSHFWFLKIDSL